MSHLRTTMDVVKLALTSHTAAAAPLKVYSGKGPANPSAEAPYVVLYLTTWTTDGTLAHPHDDESPNIQTTLVASTQDRLLWLHDEVSKALLRPVAPIAPPAGREWASPGYPIRPVVTSESRPDFDVSPPVMTMAAIWSAETTPA